MSPAPSTQRLVRLVLCLALAASGSCLVESQTIECASGVRCPAGLVCVEDHGRCGPAAQVSACLGMLDGSACTYKQFPGICRQGICETQISCERAADCDDGNPCTDDVCNQGQCEHRANTALCNDGVFCNGADHCVDTQCVNMGPAPCQGTTCDEEKRTCTGCQSDNDCPAREESEWSECRQGADICAIEGLRSRFLIGWVCNADQVCEEQIDTETETCPIQSNGRPCDDGNACTQADRCTGGTCTGQAIDCDNDNECTASTCDAATGGCRHDPLAFGTPCSLGNCDGQGTCLSCPGAGTSCITGNPCEEGRGLCATSGNWECMSVGPSPAGTPCRPAAGSCDSPEFCDGSSTTCPDDQSVPDETSCGPDGEQCLGGACVRP